MKPLDKATALKNEGIRLSDEKGQPEAAIVKLKEAISLLLNDQAHKDEIAELQYLIAMISLNLEKEEQAWKYFSRALDSDNGNNRCLSNRCNLNLGLLLYRSDKYNEAIRIFSKVKGIKGFNDLQVYMFYQMMGVAFLKISQYKKAIKYLLKALDTPYEDDRSFEAYYHLGCAYYHMGNYTKALKYYEDSISINPDQPEIFKQLTLLRLAYMYMYREEYEKAIQLCDEVEQKKDINIRLDNLYITRGRCHSRLGQVLQAVKYFEKAWEMKDQLTDKWRDRIQQWLIDYYDKVGNQERVNELRNG